MKEVLDKVKKLYTDSLKEYGVNSKSVGWTTEEGQILRFKKLCEVIEDKNTPFTVNDLGCGYGAMFEYLKKNNFNIVHYNGYDISEEMLETAKNKLEIVTKLNFSIMKKYKQKLTTLLYQVFLM